MLRVKRRRRKWNTSISLHPGKEKDRKLSDLWASYGLFLFFERSGGHVRPQDRRLRMQVKKRCFFVSVVLTN